jgi:hypothetical protein
LGYCAAESVLFELPTKTKSGNRLNFVGTFGKMSFKTDL